MTIPTIITEDVDGCSNEDEGNNDNDQEEEDKISTSVTSTSSSGTDVNGSPSVHLSWGSNKSNSNNTKNGNLRKESSCNNNCRRCASHSAKISSSASPSSSALTSSTAASENNKSVYSATMNSSNHHESTTTHPSHYHTVHGTSHIGHHHYYQSPNHLHYNQPTTNNSDGSGAGGVIGLFTSKQRNRSHSGPTYPISGFTQQIRHSALISAGMATLGTVHNTRRRQSDDSEQHSSSLRTRVSPSGSSFFDSFRYVSIFFSSSIMLFCFLSSLCPSHSIYVPQITFL